MNEQTIKLIEQLAQKLGTTSEYIWGVLIKQAPISAISDLVYTILVIIGGIVLWRIHLRLSKPVGDKRNAYYEHEELLIVPMLILALMWSILFIVCFFSLDNIYTGLFNPEYWALKQVLDLI